MSIESDLKKDGIKVKTSLEEQMIAKIAKSIATKIAKTFDTLNLDEDDLFNRLSKLNMYKAEIPEGMAEAKYFYKNNSIYFNEQIPNEDLEEFAIHECIHYLQEVKDKKGNLQKMGLSRFNALKFTGMGLNEAAVQYLTSKIIGIEEDSVKYYGVTFTTNSPSYYPVECNLIKQMAYLTGEEELIDSTFNSNNTFKEKFIACTSEKVYTEIENMIDEILNLEEDIVKLNLKLQEINERNKKSEDIFNKIDTIKKKIADTFINAQNLIITSYFDKQYKLIIDLEGLEKYRRKLENYKNLIGRVDGECLYDNYYIERMSELEHKCNMLENGGIETAVVVKKTSRLMKIIKAIKNFFKAKEISA
jgi:hypothetical protein